MYEAERKFLVVSDGWQDGSIGEAVVQGHGLPKE